MQSFRGEHCVLSLCAQMMWSRFFGKQSCRCLRKQVPLQKMSDCQPAIQTRASGCDIQKFSGMERGVEEGARKINCEVKSIEPSSAKVVLPQASFFTSHTYLVSSEDLEAFGSRWQFLIGYCLQKDKVS